MCYNEKYSQALLARKFKLYFGILNAKERKDLEKSIFVFGVNNESKTDSSIIFFPSYVYGLENLTLIDNKGS